MDGGEPLESTDGEGEVDVGEGGSGVSDCVSQEEQQQ